MPWATNWTGGSCSNGWRERSGRRWSRRIRACATAYKTACLTNNFTRAEAVLSVEVAAIYALFDAVLESRVLGVRKPDPRFYELACEALSVQPNECVFLDDLGVNLKPARALGMHTIKVADPDEAVAELEELLGLGLTR